MPNIKEGQVLKGTTNVETTGDDDFTGVVLGYSDDQMNSSAADVWLIDYWLDARRQHT